MVVILTYTPICSVFLSNSYISEDIANVHLEDMERFGWQKNNAWLEIWLLLLDADQNTVEVNINYLVYFKLPLLSPL